MIADVFHVHMRLKMLTNLLILNAIGHLFVAAVGTLGLAECELKGNPRVLPFRLLEVGGLVGATVQALLAATAP